MADMIIRRMTLSDVKAVHAVETACFPNPWSEEAFVQEMRSNPVARYLIAQEGGRVIGFAGAHIILDEGHITNVAVLKGSRGIGVGRALMEALMQYAANLGADYLTLEVRESNAKAQSLYASLGFIKVSVRKRYYPETGEDALLMVCQRLPRADPDFSEPETVDH